MQIDVKDWIGKRVAVALSGGGDSVALLDFLRKKEIAVSAVHIHHGIRQTEADDDLLFVENLCKQWQIPLLVVKFDIPHLARQHKMTVEETGRMARMQVFCDLLRGHVDAVATAHHCNDNVESVLFNLLRGTALKGVGGIAKVLQPTDYIYTQPVLDRLFTSTPLEQTASIQGVLIRPLLKTTKAEIVDYLQQNQLQWREDSSNQNLQYTRNFIRNKMLHDVEEYFPQYAKKVYTFSQAAWADDDYLQMLAKKELKQQGEEVHFSIDLPTPLFFRACTQAMEILAGKIEYSNINLQDIYRLKELQSGKKITLPNKLIAMRSYNSIRIYRERSKATFCIPFQMGEFTVDERRYSVRQVQREEIDFTQKQELGERKLYLSGENLQGVCIRTRQAGDMFIKFAGGRKKLKEYFIDKKIPLQFRDSLPLLARGHEILAIFGVEIAQSVQIDDKTEKIIELKEKKDGKTY